MTPIFDGHNDVLLRLWNKNSPRAIRDFIDGDGEGHIDLPRMHDGGMVGGMFAIYTPSDDGLEHGGLNPQPFGQINREIAWKTTVEMADILHAIANDVPNHGFQICTKIEDIRKCLANGSIAAVLHIEGAEAIGAKLEGLETLYAKGLRSLGPVWSRSNVFGHGVPFQFPASPDIGDGLTDAGKSLVKECNSLKIMLDASHLNLKGFWDLAKLSDAPLVATHSNVHRLSRSSRNLIDDQIRAIGESGGIIGLNYALDFLQDDGRLHPQLDPSEMLRHLEYTMQLAGEDCVGLGSDFDGATVPAFIGDVSGVPRLVDAMVVAGYSKTLINKICLENWMRVLGATW